ncbi:MAG: MOSC domain-containing protein [Lautropia sp.]
MPVVTDLFSYPIKSCGGVRLDAADLWETGLYLDRFWMVVDGDGRFVSQRTEPRLALVSTALRFESVQIRAPGMLRLDIPVGGFDYAPAARLQVTVFDDTIDAFAENTLVNTWFSNYLGKPVRLVRIDPDFRRVCNRKWTGDDEAITQFADAFPLLVASRASLADLNRRIVARGGAELPMDRFRPNVVIDGDEPFEEDHLGTLAGPDYTLRLVKPCARCPIPTIDQQTAEPGTEPTDTLVTYRHDARVDGVTFGMNAIVIRGADEATIKVGDPLTAEIRFD